MNAIIIVTNNLNKLKEYQAKLAPIQCIAYTDVLDIEDIEETGETFRENAFIKAKVIFDKLGQACMADDSGLIVDALPNELGVYSKRFSKAGTSQANNAYLLERLKGVKNRKAYFHTTICLLEANKPPRYYEGRVHGHILESPRGHSGFGYDPLFQPLGSEKTLAQMTLEEKNQWSHRAKAIEKLVEDIRP